MKSIEEDRDMTGAVPDNTFELATFAAEFQRSIPK